MSDHTSNLAMDFLVAGQAQKHVTVNEALLRLDALVQLSVVSATVSAEPGAPVDGQRYILPAGKTGTHWGAMTNGAIAYYRDGVWEQLTPRAGYLAWVEDTSQMLIYGGAAWTEHGPLVQSGTFTPTISFATPGDLSVSYTTQVGRYARIGSLCFIDLTVTFTPTFATASGRFEILGIPFPAVDTVSTLNIRNLTSGVIWPAGRTQANVAFTGVGDSKLRIAAIGPGVALANFDATNLPSGVSHTVGCSGLYKA